MKGFFDNVNHTQLKKQLWNVGIQDRQVLRIINKMLKSEVEGEGVPDKGTPQGGILSPLLSNIVLNELDQWVAGQWEDFASIFKYTENYGKYRALKKTRLKEGYIVRYADDFKILYRDWRTAQKWYHAVKLYLKDRLKLDISSEKSQILNLRKQAAAFLGFTIRVVRKRHKRVAHTGMNHKKKQQLKAATKTRIQQIRQSPSMRNVLLYNSFVLGVHNYYKRTTHVSIEFSQLACNLCTYIYNRLKPVGQYEHPNNPPPTYVKYYGRNRKIYRVVNIYLFPMAKVKTYNTVNFNQNISLFTEEGRNRIGEKIETRYAKGIVQTHEI